MTNNEWFYIVGDKDQQGPVSANDLKRLAESGELRPDDLVWQEGLPEWLPASRLKGMNFTTPPSTEPTASPPAKRFDAEAVQSTLRDVQQKADSAAGALWFLDLKFSRFVSANIIRVVWSLIPGARNFGVGAHCCRLDFQIPHF